MSKQAIPSGRCNRSRSDTVERERRHFKSLREWWGIRNPHGINLGDCDAYKDWRLSGGFISSYEIRGHKHTKRAPGGTRAVDIELCTLSSVFHLARRRGRIRNNPLQGRSSFVPAGDVKHCREFAPTPKELHDIEQWLRDQGRHDVGDFASFLAFTGLRIGEALRRCWSEVNWEDEVMDVKRSKKGVFPWVAITPALSTLLLQMKRRAEEEELVSDLMFPPMRGIFEGNRKRDASAIRRWLKKACTALNIRHVTPHGLRSYFVTSCRSTLTDAEIAMAIGDKSGPSLISSTYGDVRPDAFLAQIRTIQQRWISDTATGTDSK